MDVPGSDFGAGLGELEHFARSTVEILHLTSCCSPGPTEDMGRRAADTLSTIVKQFEAALRKDHGSSKLIMAHAYVHMKLERNHRQSIAIPVPKTITGLPFSKG